MTTQSESLLSSLLEDYPRYSQFALSRRQIEILLAELKEARELATHGCEQPGCGDCPGCSAAREYWDRQDIAAAVHAALEAEQKGTKPLEQVIQEIENSA
jgi:DUF1680 family protein